MKNKTLTNKWNLFKTGISTDRFTPLSAMLMGASVLLYGTIQVGLNCTLTSLIKTLASALLAPW